MIETKNQVNVQCTNLCSNQAGIWQQKRKGLTLSHKGLHFLTDSLEFEGDLVFWGGGCDTQDIFISGTPEHVRHHVKRQVEILSKGEGFVFQQVHNILADVPPENIVAMFE